MASPAARIQALSSSITPPATVTGPSSLLEHSFRDLCALERDTKILARRGLPRPDTDVILHAIIADTDLKTIPHWWRSLGEVTIGSPPIDRPSVLPSIAMRHPTLEYAPSQISPGNARNRQGRKSGGANRVNASTPVSTQDTAWRCGRRRPRSPHPEDSRGRARSGSPGIDHHLALGPPLEK